MPFFDLRFIISPPHKGHFTSVFSTMALVLRQFGKLGQARNLPKRPILYTIMEPHFSHLTSDTSSGMTTFSMLSEAFSSVFSKGP